MHRRAVFSIPLVLAATARANPAQGDPRKEKLFSTFMAPCCWRGNLLSHESPKAVELRGEIQRLIDAGRSDDEIKQTLVDRYSARILALPEGARGDWLQWSPWAALAAGLALVGTFIHRSVRQPQAVPAAASHLPELPDLD